MTIIKLDYTLDTPEERNQLVQKILEENPDINEKYMEILTDYLILCMEKQERKEKKILTDNRMVTVNKRETSFEGLVSQLENGEDGIYNLVTNDKNVIFQPKISITQKDLNEIPLLKQLKDTIDIWDAKLKTVEGKDAFIIKKALIEMRKDQYIIKQAYRKPLISTKLTHSQRHFPELDDESCEFDEDGFVIPKGVSLMDYKVCREILSNYSRLKQDSSEQFEGDLYYLMLDFDAYAERALRDYPLYERIVEYKIDGLKNEEIQQRLNDELGIHHTVEYISSLWRNKIPKLIASAAEDSYLSWYYREVKPGKYKKCSKCGEIKLAHNKYFSKNKTAKDGLYSICKCCRNAKNREQAAEQRAKLEALGVRKNAW